ncbi:hypothetical protein [Kosakonia sp. MUSA4]|uniref:hypothetical protein n=1 Tax=Kosakonia sp. MUSA4 TaxID=2067958 RepID=UPI00159B499B|nr:hypothetical protein [Kosakonia sp. MUSA4]QJT82442.1 hypothetical protein C0557_21370 [Kosakonia sp. MUSA4]
MDFETTQTKRFAQHVKCCEWYYDEIEKITNDAFLTDDKKLDELNELENRILTLSAPFLAVANIIKIKMEQLKE